MGTDTGKYWDESWNPIKTKRGDYHCTKCLPGCANCWAEKENRRTCGRLHIPFVPYDNRPIEFVLDEKVLQRPLHWRKPRTIFVCDLCDLFHPDVPFGSVLKVIGITIAAPQHTYLFLTKHPTRMYAFFACWPNGWFICEGMKYSTFSNEVFAIHSIEGLLTDEILTKANGYWKNSYDQSKRGKLDGPVPFPQPNLWLGVTVCTPDEKPMIDILRNIPAAQRWVSFEPLLADMGELNLEGIDWLVVGAENAAKSKMRYCLIENIQSIVRQGKAAGIPVFVKQVHIYQGHILGHWIFKLSRSMVEWPEDIRVRELP